MASFVKYVRALVLILSGLFRGAGAEPATIPEVWSTAPLVSEGYIPRFWTAPVMSGSNVIVGLTAFQPSPDPFMPHVATLGAYDKVTGELVWGRFNTVRTWDLAVGPNDELYFLSPSGFNVLSATNGAGIWSYPLTLSGPPAGNIVVGKSGFVYFTTGSGVLCADTRKQAIQFYAEYSPEPVGQIALASGDRLIVPIGKRIAVLDGKFGSTVWDKELGGYHRSRPFVANGGELFVFGNTNVNGIVRTLLTALNLESGAELWTRLIPTVEFQSRVVIDEDGILYYFGGGQLNPIRESRLIAFDPWRGEVKWEKESTNYVAASDVNGPIALSSRRIYWGETSNLAVFDSDDGTLIASGQGTGRWNTWDGTTPSANVDSEGFLYLLGGRSLRKFGPVGTPAESSWPKEDGDAQNTGNVQPVVTPEFLQPVQIGALINLRVRVKTGKSYILESTQFDGGGWRCEAEAVATNQFLNFFVTNDTRRAFYRTQENQAVLRTAR